MQFVLLTLFWASNKFVFYKFWPATEWLTADLFLSSISNWVTSVISIVIDAGKTDVTGTLTDNTK